MVSLARTIRNIRREGLSAWWRQMQYICDAKSGTFIGKDQFGNKYYENRNGEEEIPGRHRWVDFAAHDYNATQVPPDWHSWLSHIRSAPPQNDPVMQNLTPPWQAPYMQNLTGTRGAYKPYNTVAPKINAWEPKVRTRA
ncbi:hypothetical protein D9619_001085 [Psilocybe cf. subviscida]|uniref:NADH dehydrogenase [ubiquinone] 1 alpha subcomplex subunit n=1 Tax=Psilocybe cf. subviscida TaxID=2480587 RepID=A0A8H5F3C8_9AGAR|nr:hypothetical protein D9619_001085 [Psilocybe cf. subviscida]